MTRDVQFLENEIWTMTQKESKILLEKKTNYSIKILSSNRGKEFKFNNFIIITKVAVFINNL